MYNLLHNFQLAEDGQYLVGVEVEVPKRTNDGKLINSFFSWAK